MILVPGLYIEGQEGCLFSLLAEDHRGVGYGGNKHAKSVMTVFQPIPKFCEAAKMRHSRDVLTASTP